MSAPEPMEQLSGMLRDLLSGGSWSAVLRGNCPGPSGDPGGIQEPPQGSSHPFKSLWLRALQAWGISPMAMPCLAARHPPLAQLTRAPGLWTEPHGLEHHISPAEPEMRVAHGWGPALLALGRLMATNPSVWLVQSTGSSLAPGNTWLPPEPWCRLCSSQQVWKGSGEH